MSLRNTPINSSRDIVIVRIKRIRIPTHELNARQPVANRHKWLFVSQQSAPKSPDTE
jgi:hypothetical protein